MVYSSQNTESDTKNIVVEFSFVITCLMPVKYEMTDECFGIKILGEDVGTANRTPSKFTTPQGATVSILVIGYSAYNAFPFAFAMAVSCFNLFVYTLSFNFMNSVWFNNIRKHFLALSIVFFIVVFTFLH